MVDKIVNLEAITSLLRSYFAPPVFEDEDKTRVAGLLNTILVVIVILTPIFTLIVWLLNAFGVPTTRFSLPIAFSISILSAIFWFISRRGYTRVVTNLVSLMFMVVATVTIYDAGTIRDPSNLIYVISITLAGLLIGIRPAVLFALLSLSALTGLYIAETTGFLPPIVTQSTTLVNLVSYSGSMMTITVLLWMTVRSISTALEQSRSANLELQAIGAQLENRVAARTRALALAAEVGRTVSQVRQLGIMLQEAVELIRRRFDLYYVQIYLCDSKEKFLVLRAGSGETGQRLLGRDHRLPIGLTSITSTAVAEKRALIVEDIETSTFHQPNPLLPETCAELAVPLLVSERVVGVLDLQSNRSGVLTEESLQAFEALAGQLAVAIVNANLFSEVEQAREKIESQTRLLTRHGWDDYLDGIERPDILGYLYEGQEMQPLTQVSDGQFDQSALTKTIEISGEEVGAIKIDGDGSWLPEDIELVDDIAQQVAQQVENLRLLAMSQQYQSEAELALRRLTREGWQAYQESVGLGFIHANRQVRPIQPSEADPGEMLAYELKVRDENIGRLGVIGAERLREDDEALIAEVQEQLSAHIENLRLQQQTEQALTETEQLYQGSDGLAKATTMQEVLDTLVEATALKRLMRVGLVLYNRPWDEDNPPEHVIISAAWKAEGVEARAPVGTVYEFEQFPISYIFSEAEPYISRNIQNDEWSHEPSRQLIMNVFGANGIAAFPLRVADQTIGGLTAMSEGEFDLTDEEIRRVSTLVDQAASVIQTRLLYEQAQKRAQREQALREITEAVRTSQDPELILRRAAQQIGTVLGRKTVVRLADQDYESEEEVNAVAAE